MPMRLLPVCWYCYLIRLNSFFGSADRDVAGGTGTIVGKALSRNFFVHRRNTDTIYIDD